MNNLNSKRFIGVCVWTLIYAFIVIRGVTVGFPVTTEQIIWAYINTVLTPLTFMIWSIYLGVDTFEKFTRIKNNGS